MKPVVFGLLIILNGKGLFNDVRKFSIPEDPVTSFTNDFSQEFPDFTVMPLDDSVYAEMQPFRFIHLKKLGHQFDKADFH